MSHGSTPHVCVNLDRDKCHTSSNSATTAKGCHHSELKERRGNISELPAHFRDYLHRSGQSLCLKCSKCQCEMVVNTKNEEFSVHQAHWAMAGGMLTGRNANILSLPTQTFSNPVPATGFTHTFSLISPSLNCEDS